MIYLAINNDPDDTANYFTFDDLMNAYAYIIKYKVKNYTLTDIPFLDDNDDSKVMDKSNYTHIE